MTLKNISKWTCARCGLVLELDGANQQPMDWARFYAASPPLSPPADARVVGDLCPDCIEPVISLATNPNA